MRRHSGRLTHCKTFPLHASVCPLSFGQWGHIQRGWPEDCHPEDRHPEDLPLYKTSRASARASDLSGPRPAEPSIFTSPGRYHDLSLSSIPIDTHRYLSSRVTRKNKITFGPRGGRSKPLLPLIWTRWHMAGRRRTMSKQRELKYQKRTTAALAGRMWTWSGR